MRHLSGLWTSSLLAAFEQLGLDAEALCAHAKVDWEVMNDPSARVALDDVTRLWESAVELTGDIVLGLHVGEHMAPRDNNILAMLAVSGRTLGDGVSVATRYQTILTDGEFVHLDTDGADRVIRFPKIEDSLPRSDHQVEFVVARGQSLLSRMTGGRFRAKEIRFAHPLRGRIEEYERIFECPLLFERQDTEIVVPTETWEMELEVWDPEWRSRLEGLAAELEQRLNAPGFVSSTSQAIRNLLPQKGCDLGATARALRVSDRTLQRRLHEEGTHFREVLDATRRSIVKTALARGVTSEEIARRAGFASVRALQRSIGRWKTSNEL